MKALLVRFLFLEIFLFWIIFTNIVEVRLYLKLFSNCLQTRFSNQKFPISKKEIRRRSLFVQI